ncbi:hypothetical protein [Thermococcus sp.]
MFEIVKILYRELHYQMLVRNPMIANNERKFQSQLKNATSIKRGVGTQAVTFFFLGFMLAGGVAFVKNELQMGIMFASYALIPFIFSLYTTTVNSSYALSMGLFEPLKPLPIEVGSVYLSELLLIDTIPAFTMMLPVVFVILYSHPLAGILALLWALIGVFLGHTLGLVIYTVFGARTSEGTSRFGAIKNLGKLIGVLLFMSIFYVGNYMQNYVREHIEALAPFFIKYSFAYPFSASSIFEPLQSIELIIFYTTVFGAIYIVTLRKLWQEIVEPAVSSGTAYRGVFKARTLPGVLALTLKDFKVIFRKSSMIAGLLIPVYFVLPQIFIALSKGEFSLLLATGLVFGLGWFSSIGADPVIKIDGKELDFLRTLPLTKKTFILSKSLTMSVIPAVTGFVVIGMAYYYNGGQALYLISHAFILPLMTSLTAMNYFYRYKGQEIGIPKTNMADIIVIFIIVGVLFAIVGAPILILSKPVGYAVSAVIGLIIIGILTGISW